MGPAAQGLLVLGVIAFLTRGGRPGSTENDAQQAGRP